MSKSILQKKRILTKAGGGSSLAIPVTVPNGGTGISSYSVGDLLYASGTTTLSKLAIGTASQQLRVNAGATALEYFTPTGSGITVGTTTITSGTSTRVPFNDSGVYGEDADFTWDKTNNILNIGAAITTTTTQLNIGGESALKIYKDPYNEYNTWIETSDIADEAVTVDKMADLARGHLLIGNSSTRPAAVDFNNSGYIGIGDGTDYNSVAQSGDVIFSNAGVAAIQPGVIVNADINASAGIVVSKLAGGAASGQMLITNGTTPTWTTFKCNVGQICCSYLTTINL